MRRSNRKKQANENIEEDDEGRAILYLLLEGDKDKSNVKYDRKAARTVRKENLKAERSELRKILNEEFGWFKKDSSLNDESINKSNLEEFEIEFEENRKTRKKKKEENVDSEQNFVIEWEEDSTNNLIQ